MAPVATPIPKTSAPEAESQKNHHNLAALARKPLDRLWRGNREGTIQVAGRPDFKGDKYAKRQWIKEHMAAAVRFWGKEGYSNGPAGHITVCDPILEGHYWMNPLAVHYSNIKASDLVLVDPEGYVHPDGAQLPINTSGFFIHSAIHKARPDAEAAAHCHSVHGKTWSAFGRPVDITSQDACLFHDNLSVYKSFGGIILAEQEGIRIAQALGQKNKAVILQNHGLLTLGSTVDEAAFLFYSLEQICKVQLLTEAAEANGIEKRIIDDEDAKFTASTLQDPDFLYYAFSPEYELLKAETKGEFLK